MSDIENTTMDSDVTAAALDAALNVVTNVVTSTDESTTDSMSNENNSTDVQHHVSEATSRRESDDSEKPTLEVVGDVVTMSELPVVNNIQVEHSEAEHSEAEHSETEHSEAEQTDALLPESSTESSTESSDGAMNDSASSSVTDAGTNLIIILGYDTATRQLCEIPVSKESLIGIFNQAIDNVNMCDCTGDCTSDSDEGDSATGSEESNQEESDEDEDEVVDSAEKDSDGDNSLNNSSLMIPYMLLLGSIVVVMLNIIQMMCHAKYVKCY